MVLDFIKVCLICRRIGITFIYHINSHVHPWNINCVVYQTTLILIVAWDGVYNYICIKLNSQLLSDLNINAVKYGRHTARHATDIIAIKV